MKKIFLKSNFVFITKQFFYFALTLFMSIIVSLSAQRAEAKTVRYELIVKNEKVNMSGKKEVDFALTVNGSIPAPTLEFTEGDDAEILVKNALANEEVSIHWHGILLPPEEDGVAYVNTPPIYAGASRLFKFKIRQHGTYWYHSHTALQEQKGVYGALIIHPKKKTIAYDKDLVVVLSDWSDENADKILRNLRKDGDYYLYKKDSMRSYWGAMQAGALKTHLNNELSRMGGMDLSDVGYDAFLINGKRDSQLLVAHPGEKIRLRIINAGASSYFYVSMGVPMQVISADGIDIKPTQANEILMGMAETYDVLFTVPAHKNYELRATVQDVTGYASGWVGMGEKVFAPNKPLPNFYASMDHSMHGSSSASSADHSAHGSSPASSADHSAHDSSSASSTDHSNAAAPTDHSIHDMHSAHMAHSAHGGSAPANTHSAHTAKSQEALDTLTVDNLTAIAPTTLPAHAKVHELKLVLGGDMERYVWHINGKAINQDKNIFINEGEVVRFTFVNDTMMHHPMHLHGHFFRVINSSGEKSPLKHTVDVSPHSTRTIEFYANEPGQWMLHCHNLYHMKTGMARIIKYMSYKPSPEMAAHEKHDPHLHEHIYSYSHLSAATNLASAHFKWMRVWDEIELKIESRSDSSKSFGADGEWEAEGDLLYRRWFGNFLNLMAGGTSYDKEEYGVVGVGYILPMLIEAQLFVNHDGHLRLDLEKKFQWTKNIFSDAEYNWRPEWGGEHEDEFAISLMYGPSWHWAAGLQFTNESVGIGAQMQF